MSMRANTATVVSIGDRCVLCGVALEPDQVKSGLCDSCIKRPEAKRAGPARPATAAPPRPQGTPRAFTAADKALIRSMHGMLTAPELLALLNRRMVADLGEVPRYTLEQLHQEIAAIPATADSANDWAGLRRLLAAARRDGVLAQISTQTIQDFCVIWKLSPAQQLYLNDVIRNAQEER